MPLKEIQSIYEQIILSLNIRTIKTAFDSLFKLIDKTKLYVFQDELIELQETHKQLVHYYVTGSTDPMRGKIFSELIASLYELTDKIKLHLFSIEAPDLYYSIRRTLKVQPENISKLMDAIYSAYDIENIVQAETMMARMFKAIWTSTALSNDDMNRLQQSLLANDDQPYPSDTSGYMTLVNCQIISALNMGLQAFFDKRKMLLLIHAASSHDEEVRIRAYIGILITLSRYEKRIDFCPEIISHIDLLSENTDFKRTVNLIILRFILSRETEKINTKMKDEILPEMMKLRSKYKKFTKEISPDFFEIEMNPEWIEKYGGSTLEKTMEEFSQWQDEGADVMLFTFTNLKHFPFFLEISHWFLPFHKGISFVSNDAVVANSLEVMTNIGMMCNSDLFSFFFSISKMHDEVGIGMLEKLESQLMEWKEQKSAELQTKMDMTERIIGHYIQDLYRFYKLHPRQHEFYDIFTQLLDFHNIPILKRYFSDKNDLLNIADFYLRKNHFTDALTIYQRLSDQFEEDEMLYQKKGYCLQMIGNYEEALDDYTKAELINPQSKWLLRRMAQCFRALKKPAKALDYYFRLEKTDPENLSVLLNIGACYLEMKNCLEALKYYFKVDYLDNENGKAWRPIAWCSFLAGKYEQAQNYYRKIVSSDPTFQDYINAGHTEWALLQHQSAYDYYHKSLETTKNLKVFMKEFAKDISTLKTIGIQPEEIHFMIDKIRYSLSK